MEEFEAYIQSPDYETESAPGICFGFNVIEHAANHYEFEVMLNENPGINRGIKEYFFDPFNPRDRRINL